MLESLPAMSASASGGRISSTSPPGSAIRSAITRLLDPPGFARGFGGVELALHQLEPRAPEAGIGEVHAHDRPELLGRVREPPARSRSR